MCKSPGSLLISPVNHSFNVTVLLWFIKPLVHESKSNKTTEANKFLFVLDVVPQAKLGVDLWRLDELSVLQTKQVAAEMLLRSKKNAIPLISETSQWMYRQSHTSQPKPMLWCAHNFCVVSLGWQGSTGVVYPSVKPISNHLLSAASSKKGCWPARAAATLSASVPKVSQVYFYKCWSVLMKKQKCWSCSNVLNRP